MGWESNRRITKGSRKPGPLQNHSTLTILNRFIELQNEDSISLEEFVPDIETNVDVSNDSVSDITNDSHDIDSVCLFSETESVNAFVLNFSSKGLHSCNLNIRHIIPKLDELRLMIDNGKFPDITGLCETFLTNSASDNQVNVEGFDVIRKD